MGFQVFMLDRKKKQATVAEPFAFRTIHGEKPIEVCANAAQKSKFRHELSNSEAETERELTAMERQNTINLLKAKIRLREALGNPTSNVDTTEMAPSVRTQSLRVAFSNEEKRLLGKADQLNEDCRGGAGDDPATDEACKQRDEAYENLEALGICKGPKNAFGFQMRWMRCENIGG